jgi:hypothetical protein
VEALIDITENCFAHTQNLDTGKFDDRFWEECISLFNEGLPQIPSKEVRHFNTIKHIKSEEALETVAQSRE